MRISIGGQAISIGGSLVSLPMPRITVVGDELRRLGVAFKSWGMQPQMIDFEQRFFTSGDAEDQATMSAFMYGIRRQGANTTRIHLELWVFIDGPDKDNLTVNSLALENFLFTLDRARQNGIYVLISGALLWDQTLTPEWFDELTYPDRWDVCEFFWSEISAAIVAAGHSTTILGYELVSEPYTSTDPDDDWYGELLGPYSFTHLIARGPEVDDDTVRDWIIQLRDAIKANDPRGLVTFGALPFFDGPVGYENTQDLLDFLCPHLYPSLAFFGQTQEQAMADLNGWLGASVPLVIGETTLWSNEEDTEEFMEVIIDSYAGVITGSYGYLPDEFTTPPDEPKYPAPSNTDPAFYALFAESLVKFDSYREAFLA